MKKRDHHLRERRLHLGLSQQAVATAAGLEYQASVSKVERDPACSANARAVRRVLVRAERRLPVGKRWKPAPPPPNPIDITRALAAKVPDSPEWRALLAAMKERVFDLYDALKLEEADLILEFVPDTLARAWLDEYFWPLE